MRRRMSGKTGAAIRKLRLARGWTLAQLSDESGVPISTLSRVELGQNALNYEKLIRLCRALEVDLEAFMASEADAPARASGRRAVTRAGEGAPIRIAANAGLAAAPELIARSLSPVLLDVSAPDLRAHGPLATHGGEAYLLVLSGTVQLHSQLYAPLDLAAGDGVYFDATGGYALTAPRGPAKALLVGAGELSVED